MNKVVIFDNFFDNPDQIKNMAYGLEYRKRKANEFFEGIRSTPLHKINANFHQTVCDKILSIYLQEKNYEYNASLFFHQTRKSDLTDTQWLYDRVHQDVAILAGIVFLTPNAPINCGTQTYKKVENSYIPDIVMGNCYNRLILYPADRYHSACDLFGDSKFNRLTLLFFLNKLKLN